MSESYAGAKTLATYESHGHIFRVVRRRFNGKHWGGYLIPLHGDTPMTHASNRAARRPLQPNGKSAPTGHSGSEARPPWSASFSTWCRSTALNEGNSAS
jgi:hypothetical protein